MRNYNEFLEIKKEIENRKFDVALQRLEKLHKINPGDRFIEYEIAKIKARDPQHIEEAKKIFEKLLQYSNASAMMIELEKIAVKQGNIDKARTYFKKLIVRENNSRAYFELANLEILVRNYSSAKEVLITYLNVNDTGEYCENAKVELAKIERQLGNIDIARLYLNEIIDSKEKTHEQGIWALLELGKLEISVGNIQEGIDLLNGLLSSKLKSLALEQLIYLKIRYEKYQEAYQYYQELEKCSDYVKKKRYVKTKIFLEYKLGILQSENYQEPVHYFINQLLCYSDQIAIKHIKLHLDKDEEKIEHSTYSESVDIDKLYEYVKAKIMNMNPDDYEISDKYNVRCNEIIGKTIENKLTDTLRVVTLPNTKNILSMYPIPTINNELEVEKDIEKTKQIRRESQIDKFNRRYGKK